MVEYENKLNQLEKEKEQLRDEMVQKINLLAFQLDRQEQYVRRENILIYGIEENIEDNDDGEKVLFKLADELQIDLEDNEIQRVHRLGQKRSNNENPRPIIARFVSYKKRNDFLKKITGSKKYRCKTARLCLWRSHTSTVQATEVHAKILLWYIYLLLHS